MAPVAAVSLAAMDIDVQRELDYLDRRLVLVEAVALKLAAMEMKVEEVAADVHENRRECRSGLEAINAGMAQRNRDREQERRQMTQDRKADRKFIAQVVVASMAVITAAVGIIVSAGGSP